MNKLKSILEKEVGKIKPSEKELEIINLEADRVISELKSKVKKLNAEVFLGGSLAKKTLIKKENYDIDIFIRFKDDKNASDRLDKAINARRIHGSRDYFQLVKGNILFEIIPVLKISKASESRNITDLSYFHVNYVLKNLEKKKGLGDEIMLAKAFCYSQKCYGAESYIRGFSGYALELLVIYYGSFVNFLKAMIKAKEQIVLDPGKFYKNRQDILGQLNESKLASPIVFVDPTFKERNALAALSNETFSKFKDSAAKFLKKPSEKFFETSKINEKDYNYILEATTNRQEGDVAGSKLLKFSRTFSGKLERYFKIKKKDFEYGKKGIMYFKIEKMNEIVYPGPPINKPERLLAFKQAHNNVTIKNNQSFAKEKNNLNSKSFLEKFLKDNKKVMKDMGTTSLKLIKN